MTPEVGERSERLARICPCDRRVKICDAAERTGAEQAEASEEFG